MAIAATLIRWRTCPSLSSDGFFAKLHSIVVLPIPRPEAGARNAHLVDGQLLETTSAGCASGNGSAAEGLSLPVQTQTGVRRIQATETAGLFPFGESAKGVPVPLEIQRSSGSRLRTKRTVEPVSCRLPPFHARTAPTIATSAIAHSAGRSYRLNRVEPRPDDLIAAVLREFHAWALSLLLYVELRPGRGRTCKCDGFENKGSKNRRSSAGSASLHGEHGTREQSPCGIKAELRHYYSSSSRPASSRSSSARTAGFRAVATRLSTRSSDSLSAAATSVSFCP